MVDLRLSSKYASAGILLRNKKIGDKIFKPFSEVVSAFTTMYVHKNS